MIYTAKEDYKVYYYRNSDTNHVPVLEFTEELPKKFRTKIAAYISFLKSQNGYISEPYSRYICSGIRELRIKFQRNNCRIFYTTVKERKIILLYAFLKKTEKTPKREIKHALNNFKDYQLYKNIVEYE